MIESSVGVWLIGVRQEVATIRDLTKGANAGDLASFPMRRALQHSLLIVAEASRRIPPEFKAKRPDLPWQRMDTLDSLLGHELGAPDGGEPWSLISDHLEDLDQAAAAWLAEGHSP